MEKKIIITENAPAPIGPYSQAVQAGNMLFVSGQIPMNRHDGTIVTDGIKAETKQVMENLNAILQAAGSSFAKVVKSSIFLTDMAQFAEMNEVYETYFGDDAPARETIQVVGLPKGVNVEISVIAIA